MKYESPIMDIKYEIMEDIICASSPSGLTPGEGDYGWIGTGQ